MAGRNAVSGRVAIADELSLTTNPLAWWRADHGIVLGTGVAQWYDIINGRSALQVTTTKQPLVSTNAALGGQAVLRFDGVDDNLQCPFTLQQPYTVYSAAQVLVEASGCTIYDGVASNTSGRLQDKGSPDNTGMFANGTTGALLFNVVVTSPHYLRVLWNGAAGAVSVDGGANQAGDDTNNTAPNGITIGSVAGGTAACNMDVAEIMIFPGALSAGDISTVNAYMKRRYGL